MPTLNNRKTAQRRVLAKITSFELGRPKHRLGNPNTGIGEVIVQPQYDIYFAANNQALTLMNLFSLQQGATYNFMGVTAFQKSFGHTSLVQAGMLDSSYTFIIRALSCYVQGLQGTTNPYLNTQDLINLLSCGCDLQINHKSYFQGILGWLPGGGGAFSSGGGNTTAPNINLNAVNGWPERGNMYQIPGGIMINPQENFTFIVNPTQNAGGAPSTLATVAPTAGPPASGISAWIRFDGTLIRVA